MEKQVKIWMLICWAIQNILKKIRPWPSKFHFGGGWHQLRRTSLRHTMSLLVTWNPPRMTLQPMEFLVLVPPWRYFTEILFVVKMIISPWTTSSLITNITLIQWVLMLKKQDLMKCLVVLIRLLPIHHFPRILELCLVFMNYLVWTISKLSMFL